MGQVTLIRGARQLLTLQGPSGPRRGNELRNVGLIEDGSLLITEGLITNVGPTRRIENLAEARNAIEINASGRVVMPAFVDSHSYLLAPPAKFTDYRFPLPGGAEALYSAVQNIRSTPGKTLELQTRRLLEGFVRHGTATLNIKTGYGMNEVAEMKMLRVALALEDTITTVPSFWAMTPSSPEFPSNSDSYIDWLCKTLLPKVRQKRLARFVDLSVSESCFSVAQARIVLQQARSLGLVPKILAELTGRSGAVRLAIECEAATADGLNHIGQEDIEALSRSQTMATLLPGTVHQGSYSRFAPARDLIDAGAALALGSGYNPGVSSTMSMQMVISLACTHMKMTPEEAIVAATVNGAHALMESHVSGTLAVGKRADVVMLNVSDYRELAFHFGGNLIAMCMRAGKVMYQEGVIA